MYVETKRPLALNSYDYLYPLGAIQDNSRNPKFNTKLYVKFHGQVMDLGCAGGGFVEDCIKDGYFAIGLEGNDYCFKHKKASWANIPDNLFTCDITYPFTVHQGDGVPCQFKVITAWEVMEHIEKKDLDQLFKNVRKHLADDGVFMVSIANKPSFNKEKTHDLHRIHEDDNWWTERAASAGFSRDKDAEKYFGNDWVRNERKSFHFVLKRL